MDDLLYIASEQGLVDDVRALLSNCNDIDKLSTDDYGVSRTPLFVASQAGHPDVVRLLIDGGAKVDTL